MMFTQKNSHGSENQFTKTSTAIGRASSAVMEEGVWQESNTLCKSILMKVSGRKTHRGTRRWESGSP